MAFGQVAAQSFELSTTLQAGDVSEDWNRPDFSSSSCYDANHQEYSETMKYSSSPILRFSGRIILWVIHPSRRRIFMVPPPYAIRSFSASSGLSKRSTLHSTQS